MCIKDLDALLSEALCGLVHLKLISIIVPTSRATTKRYGRGDVPLKFIIPIDPILPTLARLEELELCGLWTQQHQVFGPLRPRKGEVAWRVKKFKTNSFHIVHCLRYCRDLEVFECTKTAVGSSWQYLEELLCDLTNLMTLVIDDAQIEESEEERAVRLAGGEKSVEWMKRKNPMCPRARPGRSWIAQPEPYKLYTF